MKFQIYKAKDGFRWRALVQNKKIVAESGEAYATKSGARKGLARFLKHVEILNRTSSLNEAVEVLD